jgi:integrase
VNITTNPKKIIKAAEKVKLTAGRIAAFQCPKGKTRAYLWCVEVKGLGVIATTGGNKSYVFQAKVNGDSMRLTIGGVGAWSIPNAQMEARRLRLLIDQGYDPRQVSANNRNALIAEEVALAQKQLSESVTVAEAWQTYITDRKPQWSDRHYFDHLTAMHAGGVKRQRNTALTIPGTLASLATIRLIDLTTELVEEWAKVEVAKRPTRARLSLRLLKAFLFWCARHPTYKTVVITNVAQSRNARESLGKDRVKDDALQREQLLAWFSAVRQIHNPVFSVYLQTLMIIGSRRGELEKLRWDDVDFQWKSMTLKGDKSPRIIPLTPYVAQLLASLPRRNEWVFSSPRAASGHIEEPATNHTKACAIAGVTLTLHGLRRSMATLSEWIEMPAGIGAQIQGHKPKGVREQHYIRRPLDLLRVWHIKIEAWILEQAGIEFVPEKAGLKLVAKK